MEKISYSEGTLRYAQMFIKVNYLPLSMKRIGIVGGTTPESSVYYYRSFIEISRELFENDFYPEMIIFNLNFQKFKGARDWNAREMYLLEVIRALERAGAEIIALSANTPHIVFDSLSKKSKAKMISIIDALAEEARKRGFRKLLLMGTKTTMTSGFYKEKLEKYGFEVVVPEEYVDEIDRIIFQELGHGNLKSKNFLIEIVENYKKKYEDLDAAILGCTELPIALKDGDTSIPLLDTAKIHMRKIIEEAMK